MGFSVTVRNALLGHYFGKSTLTPPANYYLALIKSDENEVSGGGYARVETASSDWSDPADGVITNATAVTWPTPTDTWGSITQMKLFEAASGGTAVATADLPSARDVTGISPAPEAPAGTLRMILT